MSQLKSCRPVLEFMLRQIYTLTRRALYGWLYESSTPHKKSVFKLAVFFSEVAKSEVDVYVEIERFLSSIQKFKLNLIIHGSKL